MTPTLPTCTYCGKDIYPGDRRVTLNLGTRGKLIYCGHCIIVKPISVPAEVAK